MLVANRNRTEAALREALVKLAHEKRASLINPMMVPVVAGMLADKTELDASGKPALVAGHADLATALQAFRRADGGANERYFGGDQSKLYGGLTEEEYHRAGPAQKMAIFTDLTAPREYRK